MTAPNELERIRSDSRKTAIATLVSIAIVLGSLIWSAMTLAGTRRELDELETRRLELSAEIDSLELLSSTLTRRVTSVSAPVSESVAATRAAGELAAGATAEDRERRSQITVHYYAKRLDEEVNVQLLEPTLESYGFQVTRRPAEVVNVRTNAIFFGSEIQPDDLKLVAYALISSGLQVKVIGYIGPSSTEKASIIQIGADARLDDLPPWTVEQIRATDDFRDQPNPTMSRTDWLNQGRSGETAEAAMAQ